jgi:hypothetical protein
MMNPDFEVASDKEESSSGSSGRENEEGEGDIDNQSSDGHHSPSNEFDQLHRH